jgi:glycerol-3-phosphate dehydrogenase
MSESLSRSFDRVHAVRQGQLAAELARLPTAVASRDAATVERVQADQRILPVLWHERRGGRRIGGALKNIIASRRRHEGLALGTARWPD